MFGRIVLTMSAFYSQATATRLRRVVFAMLLIWAVVDAAWTAREMPTATMSVFGAILSFGWNLLFIGLVAMVWNWLARRWRQPKRLRYKLR